MSPSEETGGYGVDSATVGTKDAGGPQRHPQSITVLTNDYTSRSATSWRWTIWPRFTPVCAPWSTTAVAPIFSRGYEYDEVNSTACHRPCRARHGTPAVAGGGGSGGDFARGPSGPSTAPASWGRGSTWCSASDRRLQAGSVTARYGSWDRHYLEATWGRINDEGSLRGRVVVANADIKNQVDYNNNDNGTLLRHPGCPISDRTCLLRLRPHQTKDILPTNGLSAYKDGSARHRPQHLPGSAEDSSTPIPRMWGLAATRLCQRRSGSGLARYMDHDMRAGADLHQRPRGRGGNTGLMFNGPGEPAEEHGLRRQPQPDVRFVGAQEHPAGPTTASNESDIQTYTNQPSARSMFDFDPTWSPSRTTATPRMTMRSSRSSVCSGKVTISAGAAGGDHRGPRLLA